MTVPAGDSQGHTGQAPRIEESDSQAGIERRGIEEELRRSKEQLAEAQSLARIGSWEWDVAANEVVSSDELYRIYGLQVGEIEPIYAEFLARVHPDDRESVDARNRAAFANHEPLEDVKRILRPDGEVF